MSDTRPEGIAWPEAFIGLGLLAFAGIVLWQTLQIPVSPLYSKVGPTIFPYITAGLLALLSAPLLVSAMRGGWQPEDEREVRSEWKALAFVLAGLVANIALIGAVGFTAASTVMFVLVAHGFGSRRPLRNAAIGFATALIAYFGFARLLGVNIGGGVVERLFGG